jgi:hypothetical protein
MTHLALVPPSRFSIPDSVVMSMPETTVSSHVLCVVRAAYDLGVDDICSGK